MPLRASLLKMLMTTDEFFLVETKSFIASGRSPVAVHTTLMKINAESDLKSSRFKLYFMVSFPQKLLSGEYFIESFPMKEIEPCSGAI